MAINIITARQSVGRVVHVRSTIGNVFLDKLISVNSTGGILKFERGSDCLMQDVDSLGPLQVWDAAQALADKNARSGCPHDALSLTQSTGKLVALFPLDLRDSDAKTAEEQALEMLLACVPRASRPP